MQLFCIIIFVPEYIEIYDKIIYLFIIYIQVPVDQPCVALDMVASITQSPAISKK